MQAPPAAAAASVQAPLLARGFSEAEVEGVLGGNLERVLLEVLPG